MEEEYHPFCLHLLRAQYSAFFDYNDHSLKPQNQLGPLNFKLHCINAKFLLVLEIVSFEVFLIFFLSLLISRKA